VSARWEGIRKRGRPQKRWIDEVRRSEGNWNNRLACSGQGAEGMNEGCIESQGTQRNIVLEKKKKKNDTD
jgi:hypothetical protein